MRSRATIRIVPDLHLAPEVKKLHVEVDYDTPAGQLPPNDVHLMYRKLSALNGDWEPLIDVLFGPLAWPLEFHFNKPEDEGTYDIRVNFTRNGRKLPDGERTGQFFVG
jgi:hypothetical protein